MTTTPRISVYRFRVCRWPTGGAALSLTASSAIELALTILEEIDPVEDFQGGRSAHLEVWGLTEYYDERWRMGPPEWLLVGPLPLACWDDMDEAIGLLWAEIEQVGLPDDGGPELSEAVPW